MKKVEELFSNDFVLKITNKIDGHTHHVEDTKLQVFPAYYKSVDFVFDGSNPSLPTKWGIS